MTDVAGNRRRNESIALDERRAALPATSYSCSTCGAPVEVRLDGTDEASGPSPTLVRSCAHVDAPVTADVAAVMVGVGGVE